MIDLDPLRQPRRAREKADEFVSGAPQRVVRKPSIWTEEVDVRIIEADNLGLMEIALELGVSFERVKKRQDDHFAVVFKEMTEERL